MSVRDYKTHRFILWGIWFVFVALSLLIAPFHEPWADEIQALLIARDADWHTLFTEILHQDGHPPLWHILLKVLIALFGTRLNITYVSIAIMSLTVGIFLFYCRVPLVYKILLPFGHYFLYQYNIISRNYCLVYLALVLLAVLYEKRHQSIWRYALTLLLLAESTTFLALPAAVLGLFWFGEAYRLTAGKPLQYLTPMCLLSGCGLVMLWQIFPLNTVQYHLRSEYIQNYPYNVLAHFPEAFFAGKNMALNLIFLSITAVYALQTATSTSFYATMRRNLPNVLCFIAVWGAFVATYFAVRPMFYHQGLIWGLFLCSVYMFFPAYIQNRKHYLFLACAVMQIYWSAVSINYDIKHPYSSQYLVLNKLAEHNILKHPEIKVQTIGFHTLPLQFILGRDRLYLSDDTPIFWVGTEEGMAQKNNPQRLLDKHDPVVVLDETDVKRCDLSYYDDQTLFYNYTLSAAAVYKGYIFYEQGARLYIHRRLLTGKI